MTRAHLIYLAIAVAWFLCAIGVAQLLRRASRLHDDAMLEATRARNCARGLHRDTLDTRVDGLPQLAWRCVDCGERVLLGVAYATGTNKVTRRTKHG